MDIERFLSENLNEHRKGILGKTVPVGSMLIWTRVCDLAVCSLRFCDVIDITRAVVYVF